MQLGKNTQVNLKIALRHRRRLRDWRERAARGGEFAKREEPWRRAGEWTGILDWGYVAANVDELARVAG